MPDTEGRTHQYDKGDRVDVEIPAYLLEVFDDGSARVDADGVEMIVAEDEWR